jgi:hypothetical protein
MIPRIPAPRWAFALLVACVPAGLHAQADILLELNNSAALPRMVVDSGGGLLVAGNTNRGTIPSTGAGTRLMWYPRKAAFRVGNVSGTQWDDANIGLYSFGAGFSATASAYGAIALGVSANASDVYAVAIGRSTVASGNDAVALGSLTTASGDHSFAVGDQTVASNNFAAAFGSGSVASGFYALAGGQGSIASGDASLAYGWDAYASGSESIALGFRTYASGTSSVVIGSYASSNAKAGAIVLADNSVTDSIKATANNQFSVRAAGGVRMFTNGTLTAGMTMAAGGSSWNAVSDRHRKEAFLAVDGEDVLSRIARLPISTWRYIAEEDRTVRHIGPMAQDWRIAFGFSSDSTTINTGDLDGVNLAAAQALTARTDALRADAATLRSRVGLLETERDGLRAEIEVLRRDNAALRDAALETGRRLERLERALAAPR